MKNFSIFAIFLALSISGSLQQSQVLPEDTHVLDFIVQVERIATVPGGANSFLGVGTLITFQHVLTTQAIYANLTLPRDVTFRFRGGRLGEGFHAQPTSVIFHAQADMAVARMVQRVDQQFSFAPMRRGVLPLNRFCTMFGFNAAMTGVTAQQLLMTAAVVRNGTQECGATPFGPFCVVGTVPVQFTSCGGFTGAPITCDGSTVAGLVVRDNFCATPTPRVYLIALSEFEEWIDDQTSAARGIFGGISVVMGLVGVMMVRIFG